MRSSRIQIREGDQKLSKEVRITDPSKPKLSEETLSKWQELIDSAARMVKVPAGLIMQLQEDTIDVFVASVTEGNPYEKGEQAPLKYGLYCETVIGNQKPLVVVDARKSETWKKDNPDVDLNMIAYLGYPISWPDGEVFGTVCLLDHKENSFDGVYRDFLLQIKHFLEQDLENILLMQRLERKSKVNNKVISIISHDIRGNVASIHHFSGLLLADIEELDKEDLAVGLKALSKSAGATHDTISQIIAWSKQDLLELDPQHEKVDLNQIIREVLAFFEQTIDFKELNVHTEGLQEGSICYSDPIMLKTVIRNLVSNAIKYSHEGGDIGLEVSNEADRLLLIVWDKGLGMTDEKRDNLFRYLRPESAIPDNLDSMGIGLMLVKEFVDKLNIQVEVETALGEGTKFKLWIPKRGLS